MNYNEYKDKNSSEKISLAIITGAKRIIVFNSESSYFIKESFDYVNVKSIKANNTELTQVYNKEDFDSSSIYTFFNDRQNKKLYLKMSGSEDPNNFFISLFNNYFFASKPISLPFDLNEGEEVFFEPLLNSTSSFGVEIDTINQQNEAIEGSGSLTLINDQDFWVKNYDKIIFENQPCFIYSYSTELNSPSLAKLIFKGNIESKTYSSSKITLKIKDLMSNLKDAIILPQIKELTTEKFPQNLSDCYVRTVYGKLQGHIPVNLDSLQDGYAEITGTISATQLSDVITGVGTQFLTQLNPNDSLKFGEKEYTISTISSNTSLTLSEVFNEESVSGIIGIVKPKFPKRWKNRRWKVANHKLKEPIYTIQAGTNSLNLVLESTENIYENDYLYLGTEGSGSLVQVSKIINSKKLRLKNSVSTIPTLGTVVKRMAVQKVLIDDTELMYERDYLINAETAILTLNVNAERNAGKFFESLNTGTFSLGSNVVIGTGFEGFLKNGDYIRKKGTEDWYEILSVESDEKIILRQPYAVPGGSASYIQYKTLSLDYEKTILTCEVLGKTDTGETNGKLLNTAPQIIKDLLIFGGFQNNLNETSFNDGEKISYEEIALCIPEKFNDKKVGTYRDSINKINKSVFGIIYQDSDFKYAFDVLSPKIKTNVLKIDETDVLNIKVSSTNKNIIKTSSVEYSNKEYDYLLKAKSNQTVSSSSDLSLYIMKTAKDKTFSSLLINEKDAQRLANRWKFLLEFSSNEVEIETKLKTIDCQVNDILDISHPKLFKRFGGASQRKIIAIEKIDKNAEGVVISGVDLSNAFNRVARLSETENNYIDATEDEKISSGFYKQNNGLINDEEDTYYISLYW